MLYKAKTGNKKQINADSSQFAVFFSALSRLCVSGFVQVGEGEHVWEVHDSRLIVQRRLY